MSDADENIDYNFDKNNDVPPDKPVPAGFYEGTVAGVDFVTQKAEDAIFPNCQIARITYRLDSEDPDLKGKRVQPFPMPVRGHKDSWKWFDWCKRMGYEVDKPFRFAPEDVEGTRVSLKFDPPRPGKGKNEGKSYDNLVDVQRLA